jgi:hypothetical protein
MHGRDDEKSVRKHSDRRAKCATKSMKGPQEFMSFPAAHFDE